jgi:hypothetical protein
VSEEQGEAGPVPATDGGGSSPTADGSNPYGGDTDAASRHDGATKADAGASDATPGASDAGPAEAGGGGVRTDLCIGTTSQQATTLFGLIHQDYDDLCDGYYYSTSGRSKACAASGNSCAAFTGSDGYNAYCCYIPSQDGFCVDDYHGQAQCVPK